MGFYEDLKCEGEPYHSANVLKCELHALAYEIERTTRAGEAEKNHQPWDGKGTFKPPRVHLQCSYQISGLGHQSTSEALSGIHKSRSDTSQHGPGLQKQRPQVPLDCGLLFPNGSSNA